MAWTKSYTFLELPFMNILLLSTVLCVTPLSFAAGQSCSKQSPAHTVALLELYTSEGCNSCPPADKFVSGLRNQAASGSKFDDLTGEQVVPLSLHVDYWDYIGWNDRFAKSAFTVRQRWLAGLANSRTVYTPEVFVGGQELRNWSAATVNAIKRVNGRPAQADIGLRLGNLTDGRLRLQVTASSARPANLYLALYENGLASVVKAGENRGVTLRHDYVVRDWIGPVAVPTTMTKNAFARVLAVPADAQAKNLGVAAFVQAESGEVLQALALPLCGDD